MATQVCERCGFSAYDETRFSLHVENAPESCIDHLKERAVSAEARADAFSTVQRDMSEKFMTTVERVAQLLAPDAAKKLEKFIGKSSW